MAGDGWTAEQWRIINDMADDIKCIKAKLEGNGKIGLCDQADQHDKDIKVLQASANWRMKILIILASMTLLLVLLHLASGELNMVTLHNIIKFLVGWL